MNEVLKKDILLVKVPVTGESQEYQVSIKLNGVCAEIAKNIKSNNNKLEFRTIIQALTKIFNTTDVYVNCTCPDYKYRMHYWNTRKGLEAGDPQTDPGKGIVNPHDTKGNGCKHVLLVLSNNSWIIKVSSVIRNYVHYMAKHEERLYKEIIYPALHGHEYKGDDGIQQEFKPNDNGDIVIDKETELGADETALDTANKWAKTKNLFQKGNQSGIQFARNNDGGKYSNKRTDGQYEFTTDSPKLFNFDDLMSDK